MPVYMFNQWQDEHLPGRIWESLGKFSHPDSVWANFSNGNHGRDYYNATDSSSRSSSSITRARDAQRLSGPRAPPECGHGDGISRDGKTNEPAWSIDSDFLRLPVTARSLYLRADGR